MIAEDETIQQIEKPSVRQLREVAFARMIERGLADSDQGRTIDHEEMERIIATWGK